MFVTKKFTQNNKFIAIVFIFLIIALIYVSDISNLPSKVILFEGEPLNLRTILGVNVETSFSSNPNIERIENNESVTVSAHAIDSDYTGTLNLEVSFLGIKVKDISVDIIENAEVVPLGNLIGMKLYTNGVLVVGMSEITGKDMERYKPYENSGITEGDIIIEANNKAITCTSDLTESINEAKNEEITLTYIRDGSKAKTRLKPIQASDNTYKIGLWVRDTAAGVGTATFYDIDTNNFASLGHGIVDVDTEELVEIATGEVVNANILSVLKGKEGSPGRIQGSIEGRPTIGTIYKNTNYGVYGTLISPGMLDLKSNKKIPVALRSEIQEGKASLISTLENDGPKEYEIEITKIYTNNNIDNKSMVIKITDSELLEKSGGIVQGMSGSPIIQNGKLVRCTYSCNGE